MATSVLGSWRDGPAKESILAFVAAATTPGPSFIDAADRVAAFDNDGTLWVEQPLPPQFDFVFRKWARGDQGGPVAGAAAAVQGDHREGPGVLPGVATQDPEVVATCWRRSPGPGRAPRRPSSTPRCASGRGR